MVQRQLKIPKHGGPDGAGLPQKAFNRLLEMFDDAKVSDSDIQSAIELCLSASTQSEWDKYREELMKRMDK